MSVRAAKKLLRKELKQKLNALTEEEKIKQSNIVINKVLKHEKYLACQRLSIFLNMNDEIITRSLVEHALNNNKSVFIPKYVSTNMDMVQLNSMDDLDSLPKTKWNIQQPADDDFSRENAIETGGLDLIIMPGLGFNKEGKRLGRGKGYYDTYLEKLSDINCNPYLMAISYNCQICTDIPVDHNDKLVNIVITAD